MKMIAPNIARPITKPSAAGDAEDRASGTARSGMIGSAARRSCQTNAPSSATPATARPTIVGRAPGVLVAAPGGDQDERADARGQQRGAEVVDRVALRRRVQVQAERRRRAPRATPIGMFT